MSESDHQRPHVTQSEHQQLRQEVHRLESDVKLALNAVTQLSETVNKGFSEVRKLVQEQADRSDKRASELHKRITDWSEHTLTQGQPTMKAVTAVAMAVLVVLGGLVSFTEMRIHPVRSELSRMRPVIREQVPDLRVQQAVLEERMDSRDRERALREEISDLRSRLRLQGADDDPFDGR